MWLPFRQKEKLSEVEIKPFAPYEEISEKKTTKLGYFLLIMMVLLGVWRGQGFIDSLSSSISGPEPLSNCVYFLNNFLSSNTYNYNTYYNEPEYLTCNYSSFEKKYFIEDIMQVAFPLRAKLISLNRQLVDVRNNSNSAKNNIDSLKGDYSLTLQEKIARENSLYDKNQIKGDIIGQQAYYSDLVQQEAVLNAQISDIENSLKSLVNNYKDRIAGVFVDYNFQNKLVEFERALLQFLFIVPLLWFALRKYFKNKRENSQYTIIWSAVVGIFALLFSEVCILFIYRIIPRELIQWLMQFFAQFAFLVTIFYYATFLLVPVIFGFIVYLIQKRVYNKEAVMIRALKNHKCPSCNMSLRNEDRYCPSCHYQMKDKCDACGMDRVVGLRFCPNCGVSK